MVSHEVGEQLLRAVEADPTLEFTIDIERCLLEAPAIGLEVEFPLDEATKQRFLQGLDDISLSLAHTEEIDSFEANRPAWLQA